MASSNIVQFPINPNAVLSVGPAKRGRGRPGRLPPGVVAFDIALAAKRKQVVDEQAVSQAIDAFTDLVKKHGCRWVTMSGFTIDDRWFHAESHSGSCGEELGVDVFIKEKPSTFNRTKN